MLLRPAQRHVMLRATREQGTQVNTQLSLGVEVGAGVSPEFWGMTEGC